MAKKFWITRTVVGYDYKILIVPARRSPKAAIFGPFENYEDASEHLKGYMQHLIKHLKSRPE
jgi:effector-binding domain-containing protein